MAQNNLPENNKIKEGKGTRINRASKYTPIHGERLVKIYPIQEHELKTIGICNLMVSVGCSVGFSCLTLLVSCLWSLIVATPTGQEALSKTSIGFMSILVLLCIGAFIFAGAFQRMKSNQIQQIQAETVMPEHDQ